MAKKILILILCLFVFITPQLIVVQQAQAFIFLLAPILEELVGSLLVAGGMTFATSGAMDAAITQFMAEYGPAASEIMNEIATVGVGTIVTVSGTIANAINDYVNNQMPQQITNPTQSISWQKPFSATTVINTDTFFDNTVNTWLGFYAYHPINGSSGNQDGRFLIQAGPGGTTYYFQWNVSYAETYNSTSNNYTITNVSLQSTQQSNNWTPDPVVLQALYQYFMAQSIGRIVASGYSQTCLIATGSTHGTWPTNATAPATNESATLGANTVIDTNQALKDLTGAQVKVADATALLNQTASVVSTQIASSNSILSDIRTGVNSVENWLNTSESLDFTPLKVAADAITTKFPFSLPWDVLGLFQALVIAPSCPPIDATLPNPQYLLTRQGDSTIHFPIDISIMFGNGILVIRDGLLLLFTAGLVLLTTRIFGGQR